MEPQPRKQRRTTSPHIDESKPAFLVVTKAGGLSRFSEITGLPTSTVHRHMKNGFFPNPRHEESGLSLHGWIIQSCREQGVEINPAELIEQDALDAA